MTSFAYDIIDSHDLIWIPTKYGSIRNSKLKEIVPPMLSYTLSLFLLSCPYDKPEIQMSTNLFVKQKCTTV